MKEFNPNPSRERLRTGASMTTISFKQHDNLELAAMLVIDGVADQTSRVNNLVGDRWARIESTESAAKLCSMSCRELAAVFSVLELPLQVPEGSCVKSASFVFTSRRQVFNWLDFNVEFDLANWASPWSIIELVDSMQQMAEKSQRFVHGPLQVRYSNSGSTALAQWSIHTGITDMNVLARDLLAAGLSETMQLIDETLRHLQESVSGDILLTTFHFPLEVSAACQQYLVYFVQFLKDLGIEATSDLKQEAARVLFSVKPSSGAEALEAVREALRAYLNLPNAPEFIAASEGNLNVAVAQLRANVLHLQSQLSLAQAITQAKDATIEALKLANFQLEQLKLTADTQARHGSPEWPDREPVIGEFVSVTKYEGKGFEIDLPKLFRQLKRKFGT